MTTDRPARTRWLRLARNGAIVVVALVVLFGLLGFFVAPRIVKSVAETQILEKTGRKATIGAVELNPYRLSARIVDFTLYEPDGTTPAAEVGELLANVSSASLFKRALVFDALAVRKPRIHVVRLDAERFSFSDILDKLAAEPKSEEPVRFSLNNIELDDGSVAFDDRVTNTKHVVDAIRIGVPFVSNLPYDTEIYVTPQFAATVDGSPLVLGGKAQLFSERREATVSIDLTGLDIPSFMSFAPPTLRFRVASAKLDAHLKVDFKAAGKDAGGQDTPQSLVISGPVSLDDVKITDAASHEAVAVKRIEIDADNVEPLRNVFAFKSVALVEPRVRAVRRPDGSIDLATLFVPAAPKKPASPPPTTNATTPASSPVAFSVGSIRLDGGRFDLDDQALATAATTTFDRIDLKVDGLASQGDGAASFALSVRTSDNATIEAKGSSILSRKTVSGAVRIRQLRPGAFSHYLSSFLAARIGDGTVAADAKLTLDASGPELAGVVEDIDARIEKLRTQLPNEKSSFVAADEVVLGGGAYDLATRAFTADELTLVAPVVAIKRDRNGRMNVQAALVAQKPADVPPSPAPKTAVVVQPTEARAFTAAVKAFTIRRGDVAFEDDAQGQPVRVRAAPFDLKAENVGTATEAPIPFQLDATIDQRGKLGVQGKVAVTPLTLDASIDANRVPLGWAAAYSGNRLNITIDDAELDAKGTLRIASTASTAAATTKSTGGNAFNASYRGSAGIERMRALDRVTREEFVRWKLLSVPRIEFDMPARNAPFSVNLGPVSLDDFYARLIVNANGRLNVQDVVSTPGQQRSVTTPENEPAANAAESAQGAAVSQKAGESAKPIAPPSVGPKPAIRVAGVKLARGRIGFTDNFIKPNYGANLANLTGEMSGISSTDAKPADLKMTGTIDGDGALDVSGRVDAFAAQLFVDVTATAKDIELTRLTPYAVKYAGYPIERGKLSTTVTYHIENGRLDAQNRLFLDQLTFGERDTSSSANLPVRLAVALLKNSRGEIDLNLPVSGTLSDPQFSIGGVIWRALVNLVARAVTSPFALIGSAFGGSGGGELGYIQFAPGVSDLTPQGKEKLVTLGKALTDRPALRLDIIGRYDPVTDPDGIKRDHLLDRLKDAKAKELSKPGARVERNDVTVAPGDEYAKYLAQVYDDTKLPDKPRNLIGLAKSIPVADMERLLLADIKLDPNDPRWLAEARADVVRHYLEDQRIPASRLFLVTPRLTAAGIDDKGVPNRVDFALR